MSKASGRLTVYFEDPFWVGVFERLENGRLSAAKVTFGPEPGDWEICELIEKYYYSLRFSPEVELSAREKKEVLKKNPKRAQREARKQLQEAGTGTKSQQALKLQQEQNKKERREKRREEKLAEAERIFAMKQRKKKERRRGR